MIFSWKVTRFSLITLPRTTTRTMLSALWLFSLVCLVMRGSGQRWFWTRSLTCTPSTSTATKKRTQSFSRHWRLISRIVLLTTTKTGLCTRTRTGKSVVSHILLSCLMEFHTSLWSTRWLICFLTKVNTLTSTRLFLLVTPWVLKLFNIIHCCARRMMNKTVSFCGGLVTLVPGLG